MSDLGVLPTWVAGPRGQLPAAQAARRRTLELTIARQQVEEGFEENLAGGECTEPGQIVRVYGSHVFVEGHSFYL